MTIKKISDNYRLPGNFIFALLRPDGDVRWIEHACQPVHGNRGEFLGFRASNRDITARKQTEIQEQQHRKKSPGRPGSHPERAYRHSGP